MKTCWMRYSAASASVSNMTVHFVDTHAHICSESFRDDFEEMIRRTEEAHVDRIMIITLSNEETKRAVEFAQRDPYKYTVAAGIFPEDVKDLTDAYYEEFMQTASMKEVSVIGEIGLDYYWEKDPGVRALQRELFVRQIELARKLNKPIAVHSRDAMQDTFDIMKEHHWKGLMHCFAGSKEMAAEFTKLGYYIALGGPVTFKNARHSAEVVTSIDEKYLLTETDCPYMAPVPKRGKRNEPAYIPYIAAKMAELRGVSIEYIADVILRNWDRFLEQCA